MRARNGILFRLPTDAPEGDSCGVAFAPFDEGVCAVYVTRNVSQHNQPAPNRGSGGGTVAATVDICVFFFLVLIALFDWVTRAPGKDPFAKTLIHRTDRSFALAALA